MKKFGQFVMNRNIYIMVYVLQLLLSGVMYHFLPQAPDIMNWVCLIWSVVIIVGDAAGKRLYGSLYQWLLWIFVIIMVVSTIVSGTVSVSVLMSIVKHIGLMYVLFSASRFTETDEYELTIQRLSFFIVLYVFVFALASAVCYWTYKAGITLPMGLNAPERIFTYGHYGTEERFCGLFGYSTYGGNLCVLALVLSWYLRESTVYNTALTIIVSILFGYMVMLLDYRTGMLICLFVAACLLWKQLRKRYSVFGCLLILLFLAVIGGTVFWIREKDYFARFLDLMKTDPFDAFKHFSTGRTEYWSMIIEKLPDHFWLGWGWLNSEALEFYFDSHNLFFNLLMWTGVLGCGVFAVFLVVSLVRIVLSRKMIRQHKSSWLIILVLCVLMESLLDRAVLGTAENVETAMFWIALGYLIYLNRSVKGAQNV